METLTYSNTFFDVTAKDGQTTELRLQTYFFALKYSYARGELARLGLISGDKNSEDPLTKISTLGRNKMKQLLLETNQFTQKPF